MKKKFWTLKNLSVAGRTVLVRTDFNVPLDKQGKITDDNRIRASLPTIQFLLRNKCRIVLMSHLGRPKCFDAGLKMDSVAERLQELLKHKITKLDVCIGEAVRVAVNNMKECDIILLENLRFYPEEEKNSKLFARELSNFADVYVDDAFGAIHRSHASVDAITDFLPSCAGFLVEKELSVLGKLLASPARPFIAIMGGAKVSDKINVIQNLLKKVDLLLIGGAMMFTFLKSLGNEVGKSLVENPSVAKTLLLSTNKILLPVDVVVAKNANDKPKIARFDKIPAGFSGFDIGPETTKLFAKKICSAKTIFWNGPLGMCEVQKFAKGTETVAKAIAKNEGAKIAGGGDTIAVIDTLCLSKKFTHLSTGGGATLEFLEGKKLPGIDALERSFKKFSKYIGGQK